MKFFLKVVLILVCLLSVLVVSSYKGKAQTENVVPVSVQAQERLILRKRDFNPPVMIKGVKTKGRDVPLSKKFTDDDNWLKGFSVRVRNNAVKAVTHIGIEMLFRPTGDRAQLPAGWFLNYGPNPFHEEPGTVITSSVASVFPGDEVEIRLEDTQFEKLMAFLRKAGCPSQIHTVEIRVNTLGFADGTAWFGKMLKRDSTTSSGWRPVSAVLGSSQSQHLARAKPNSFF